MPVSVKCDWCEDSFKTVKSQVEKNDNNFCDRGCYLEHHSAEIELVSCDTCGDEVKLHSNEEKNYDNNFCDRECYLQHHSSKVTTNCSNCGSSVEVKGSRYEKSDNNFCDRDCYSEWHENHHYIECYYCGEELRKEENQLRERNFCSQECMSAWQSEEYSGDGNPQYEHGNSLRRIKSSFRDEIFDRDDYTCRDCRSSGKHLNVHHIYRASEFPELLHEEDNCITLCIDCHIDRHRQAGEMGAVRLLSGLKP